VHEVYREWRAVGEEYDPPRIFVAEAWVSTPERLAAYLRPDELHTAFDFDFVRSPWRARDLRATATASLAAHESVGAPVMWVLSNHDIVRHVTRYGRPQPGDGAGGVEVDPFRSGGGRSDTALGLRRARAALLLELALPGGVYLYQGEELGLPEVEDLPDDVLADPVWERSGRTERGRDGCRVPLPWATEGPSFGFGPGSAWLPQPAGWAALSVHAQDGDPASPLNLYRQALALRSSHPALGPAGRPAAAGLTWLDAGDDVLAFTRDPGFACWLNTGEEAVPLPPGRVLLASAVLEEPDRLPRDVAVWLALDETG
jgi:alpha-glucosidase